MLTTMLNPICQVYKYATTGSEHSCSWVLQNASQPITDAGLGSWDVLGSGDRCCICTDCTQRPHDSAPYTQSVTLATAMLAALVINKPLIKQTQCCQLEWLIIFKRTSSILGQPSVTLHASSWLQLLGDIHHKIPSKPSCRS